MKSNAKLHRLLRFISRETNPELIEHKIQYIPENMCLEIRFFTKGDSVQSQYFIQYCFMNNLIFLWNDLTEEYTQYSLKQIKQVIKIIF